MIQEESRGKPLKDIERHCTSLIYFDICWSLLILLEQCCMLLVLASGHRRCLQPSTIRLTGRGVTWHHQSAVLHLLLLRALSIYCNPKKLGVCASVLWQKHHTWYMMAVKVLKGSVVSVLCSPGCTTSMLLLISCSSVTSVNHSLSALTTQSCGQGRGGDRWQVTVPSQMMEAFGLRI